MKRIILTLLCLSLTSLANAKGNGNSDPGNNVWAQLEAMQAQIDALAAGSPPATASVSVDCDAGETITDALTTPANELTIEFSGTCQEAVTILRQRVILKGTAAATIDGSLVVRAADADLQSFSVTNSPGPGLFVDRGSRASIIDVHVSGSAADGFLIAASNVLCADCSATNNGWSGMSVVVGAQMAIAGTTIFSDNSAQGLSIGDASGVITLDSPQSIGAVSPTSEFEFNNNGGFGVLTFASASLRFSAADQIDVHNNGQGILVASGASTHLDGTINISGNNLGLGILGGTVFHVGDVTSNGNDIGVFLDDNATLRGGISPIRSNNNSQWGFFVRSSYLGDANISATGNGFDEVFLLLGARVNTPVANVSGQVNCDGTEILAAPFNCGANP